MGKSRLKDIADPHGQSVMDAGKGPPAVSEEGREAGSEGASTKPLIKPEGCAAAVPKEDR